MITPSYAVTATERVLPKLALDFTTASLDPRVTFARADNTATRINQSGNVEVVNADLPRFDYDPTTLACKGLLIEESRINRVRNNTMVGAVAGSPGTIPTNGWFWSSITEITRTIVGTGIENGIDYIDIRFNGTVTASRQITLYWETSAPALNAQAWTSSVYFRLVGGSLANLNSLRHQIAASDGAFGFLNVVVQGNIIPTGAPLITQRNSITGTTSNASTAYLGAYIFASTATSGDVDFTLRIGLPQLELGAFATSVIKTSSAAVTRNADVATMTGTNFSSWFNPIEGSIYIDAVCPSYVATTQAHFYQIDDGTAANRFRQFIFSGLSGKGYFQVIESNNGQANLLSASGYAANQSLKTVNSYKASGFLAAYNGESTVSGTAGLIPTVNTLRLGSEIGGNYLNSVIKRFSFYDQQLTSAETQAFSK